MHASNENHTIPENKGEINLMWLEVKALMTGVGIIIILVGILTGDYTLFTLIISMMGMGIIIFGDLIVGYQITKDELKTQMDSTPKGFELTAFQEINGRLHFINTKKAMLGQRKFRFHNKEAVIITNGKGMFTLPNGNRGFFSHEKFDKNIEPGRAKALSQLNGDSIKEIYENTLKEMGEKIK